MVSHLSGILSSSEIQVESHSTVKSRVGSIQKYKFDFLTAMNIKVTVSLYLTPYTFVGRYQCFGKIGYYHLEGSRSLCPKDRYL